MMQLTALPVTGEAYLVRFHPDEPVARNTAMLIDGGYAASTLVPALRAELGGTPAIDVVVCTHADDDHAGGLEGLLDAGVKVGEFWLPGSWYDVAGDLLRDPETLFNELVDEVRDGLGDARLQHLASGEPDKRAEALRGELSNALESVKDGGEDERGRIDAPAPLPRTERKHGARTVERAARNAQAGLRRLQKRLRGLRPDSDLEVIRQAQVLIQTARRVATIARAAEKHAVPVRWFDHLAYLADGNARGGSGLLEPVNAIERIPRPVRATAMFRQFLRLSRVNEECLVFRSRAALELEILFCGDSPLGSGRHYADPFLVGQAERALLVTAPHHGAESNAIAYKHIKNYGPVFRWIRAGGKPTHPGPTYQDISPELRMCTRCPHLRLAPQRVRVTVRWDESVLLFPVVDVRGRECVCTSSTAPASTPDPTPPEHRPTVPITLNTARKMPLI